jgi:AcrR family transcriptional regulator
MRDVAARAEVALGTLYRHYASKDQLLLACMAHQASTLRERLDQRPPRGDAPADRVADVLRRATRALERQPRVTHAMVTAMSVSDDSAVAVKNEINQTLRAIIVDAVDGAAVTDLDDIVRVLGSVWFAELTFWSGALTDAQAMGDNLAPGAVLPSPQGTLEFQPVSFPLEGETAAALDRRPDLRLARLLVRASREDQRIVNAAFYPRLDLTLYGQYVPKTNLRQPGAPSTTNLVSSEILGGASYTWRVIDNGKVSGASLQQQSAREMNELQLQKLETSVGRELAGLTNNFRAIAARHDSLSKAVEVAEKNVAVVEQSWQQGLASQLEFRTAETDLLATRSGILKAAYQQEMTRAEWDRATGRYFQFSDDATPKVHSSQQ